MLIKDVAYDSGVYRLNESSIVGRETKFYDE